MHRQRKFGGLLDGGLRYGLGNHMEDVYIPTNTLDALNAMIADNFIYLPLLSGAIYAVWSLIIWKQLKSVWYISLGAPAIVALIILLIDFAFLGGLFNLLNPIFFVFILLPGYIIPSVVCVVNAVNFSRTDVMSITSYVLGGLIAFAYFFPGSSTWSHDTDELG